jgi:hypothetical protein
VHLFGSEQKAAQYLFAVLGVATAGKAAQVPTRLFRGFAFVAFFLAFMVVSLLWTGALPFSVHPGVGVERLVNVRTGGHILVELVAAAVFDP